MFESPLSEALRSLRLIWDVQGDYLENEHDNKNMPSPTPFSSSAAPGQKGWGMGQRVPLCNAKWLWYNKKKERKEDKMKTGYVFKPRITRDNTERVESSSPQAQARRAQREIEQLGHEVHRLYMVTEALWTLIRDRTDLDDEQLMDLISKIDLRDNVRSEMAAESEIHSCPTCGRTLSIRHTTCIFCGEFIQRTSYGR